MRNQRRLLTYALALAVPLFTWAQTESEPNNNWNQNNPVAEGSTMTGSSGVCSPTDNSADWFELNMSQLGQLKISTSMSNDGPTSGVSLVLYNESVGSISSFNLTSGVNGASAPDSILFTCRGTGTYYLRFNAPTAGCLSYTFSYEVVQPVFAADNENNDNWNTANTDTVAVNTNADGRINFSQNDDNSDFHILTLDDDGILNVHIQAEHVDASTGDSLTVRLYTSNMNQLKLWRVAIGASSTPLDSTVSMTCLGNEQRYFLQFASDACGTSYRFSYDVTPPVFADDNEENDNWNTVNTDTVAVSTDQDGRLNFNYDDNSDFHILTLDDDGILNVHIQAEHVDASTGDSLTVRLYTSNMNQLKLWRVAIGASSTPLDSTVSMTCLGNEQRYFLQFASAACGTSYRFSYDVTPPVFADDNENNDNWNHANTDTVAVSTDQDGRLNFNYDDNSDFHILTLDDDGILNVHIQAEHVDASTGDSLTVRLYNSNVSQLKLWRVAIGASSTPLDSTVSMTCLGNEQRYFLQFASDACGTSYRFSYNVPPPVFADDNEENDNWSTANTDTVAVSTDQDGRLNFNYDDNSDFHILTLDDDGILNVHIQAEHVDASTGDSLTVRLYNSNVNQLKLWRVAIGASSTPLDSTVSMTCLGNEQRYFLQFASDACGTSYRFSYDVTSPVYADDNENNDNWNSANTDTIFLDSAAVTGRLAFEYDDNTDFYKVVLTTTGAISVDSRAENANTIGTYEVRLYNSSVNQIATHTYPVGGSSSPASDSWTSGPLAAGTYYLQATNAPCGTSYSFLCNDDDDDGVCNGFDLCAGTPNGEGVNADGCSCSQVTVDDGDECTLDVCLNGDVTHTFQDADGDLTCDANDGCPNDPNKIAPGACGCGFLDVPTTWYADADGDGFGDPNSSVAGYTCIQPPGHVANNTDLCDGDINKTDPGACGCGEVDTDTDTDGMADCIDPCPNDPTNTCNNCNDPCYAEFGQPTPCATFVDTDGDGACDATDLCDNDPLKTTPGACGCGNPDVPTTWYADTDGDGFGDPSSSVAGYTCIQPPGHVANNTDLCDDDINKTSPGACGCGEVDVPTTWYADTDGDGLGDPNSSQSGFTCNQPMGYVADNTDLCPTATGTVGSSCDDGNPNTTGDVLDANCNCVGTPSGCTQNLVLEFDTDANAAEITWELRASGSGTLVQSGGGLPNSVNNYTVSTCVPDGCYYLRVLDSGGDGIVGGGYTLRMASGARIIDNSNNFTTGSVSAVIGNGGFCLPLGTDQLIYTSCDKLDWVNNQYIVASPNAAVSAQWGIGNQTDDGYQFWFFDPNGSYGYAKFRNHATSDGFGPANATRACHARINNWSPNQIPANVLMNVKVRSRVNGVNSAWGPVCRFKIDPVRAACPLTKLMDIPGNANFSCGVTRAWGSGSANKVVAKPVDGATQYQFRFVNGEVPAGVVRTTTTPMLQLNWSPALGNGTYEVQVRAFKNGAWCVTSLPWGDVCNVTITGSPNAMVLDGGSTTSTGDVKLNLFPNPNNGQQLTVSLSAVEAGVETISVDIFDLNGARVSAQVLAVHDGMVYQVVDVAGLADGLYMVNITAGGVRYTERLVIAK